MDRVKWQHRVRASSLVEVVISMVIIVVVFGVAMMIMANITKGSLSLKKIQAQAILKKVLINEEGQAELTDKTLSIDGVAVEQKVKPYGEGLSEVHLTAYDDNNEKITEVRKVVQNKNE